MISLMLPGKSAFVPDKPQAARNAASLLLTFNTGRETPKVTSFLNKATGRKKDPSVSSTRAPPAKAAPVSSGVTAVQKKPRRRRATVIAASPSKLDKTQVRRARLLGGTSPEIASSASRSLLSASRAR
jgi:hypothetical protein